MNRIPANAYDSDDSASDWDTTAAESPVHSKPPVLDNSREIEQDGDYAVVVPKPRQIMKGPEADQTNPHQFVPKTTPRKDVPKRKDEVFSPPPHLHSFKNALSDYSEVYEPAPSVPPKQFDDRGQVYSLPDTGQPSPSVIVNWDDSDADEKVLRELRQNREKERQKQESKQEPEREQAVTAMANQAYEVSPRPEHSSKSVLEQWVRESKSEISASFPKSSPNTLNGDPSSKKERPQKKKTRKPALLPVVAEDSFGKKCIFYFDQSRQERLEADEEDVDAFLPEKIDEVEKLFRRVWKEIFSMLRIITSFFVLFVTEFLNFVIHHILQPLVLDSLTALGNYFFKPLVTIVFNMIIQPFFALLWNSFNALYLASGPLIQLLGAVCSKIAILLQSLQLFHVSYHSHPSQHSKQSEIV